MRSTALSLKPLPARPYTVSVGTATSAPCLMSSAASVMFSRYDFGLHQFLRLLLQALRAVGGDERVY